MNNVNTLTLDGIVITVERKYNKNMYLRARPDGTALLTAPKLMSDSAIERFAKAHLPWLRKRLQAAVPQPVQQYETNDVLTVWGRPYTLLVEFGGKRAHVTPAEGVLRLAVPEGAAPEARQKIFDKWYRTQLDTAIRQLTPECEAIVGKHASVWKLRDMTTRWGTCNTQTGAITVNLQLVRREPQYLRYIMLHELTHLHEPSHNARFYALMDTFCPGWKQLRKQLKQGT